MYDYLVVGAGLFGSTVAYLLHQQGYSVVVAEKTDCVGGMAYTHNVGNIFVHKYGAHIFRTSEKWVWDFITQFGEFKHYTHSPIAYYKGVVYNLPFNMNTFAKLWGITTPEEAKNVIQSQIVPNDAPSNLEEFALATVGRDVYKIFIEGYTEKQWGVPCRELPIDVMRRIPMRWTYDNNYYSGKQYQGIPINGYTDLVRAMLRGIDVHHEVLGIDAVRTYPGVKKVIYTGPIDEFFGYMFGHLGYRSLRFEEQVLPIDNYQGASVVNFTDKEVPYTRIIEHKHFVGNDSDFTVITREFPCEYTDATKPFYPLLDTVNHALYNQYVAYATSCVPDIVFCGRLGSYRYTDMEDTIINAHKLVNQLI